MSLAFTVMPMKQTIELEAGQTYTGYIVVSNPQAATEDFHYVVRVAPYSVVNEDYQVDLTSESNRTLMSKWITVDKPTGSIKPNGSEKIYYTIRVPETAPAGGQYAAITVATDARAEVGNGGATSVQNIFEIASILYASVKGETKHSGKILENSIPGFSTSNEVKTTLMLKNDGNVHEVSKTTITIKEKLSGAAILDSNNTYEEVVMPETTRYINRQLSNLASLGIYEVTQSVEFVDGVNSSVTQTLIICPVWFIALIILTILAIAGVIFKIVRRRLKMRLGTKAA